MQACITSQKHNNPIQRERKKGRKRERKSKNISLPLLKFLINFVNFVKKCTNIFRLLCVLFCCVWFKIIHCYAYCVSMHACIHTYAWHAHKYTHHACMRNFSYKIQTKIFAHTHYQTQIFVLIRKLMNFLTREKSIT